MTDTEKAALERRIDELCAEVELLRALACGAANEADRLTHDAAALQIENVKLRELAEAMPHCFDSDCNACPLASGLKCTADEKLRKLGIEVDE